MRFDDEQRRQILACLPSGMRFSDEQKSIFLSNLHGSIHAYREQIEPGPSRPARDALRRLWMMCIDDKPRPDLAREAIRRLPRKAVEYVDRRFNQAFPELAAMQSFQTWAAEIQTLDLHIIRVVSADGARWVNGRSRGRGKRSGSRVEPIIMGQTSGLGDGFSAGGRPANEDRFNLVANLAIDWLKATGSMPVQGRSDRSEFGDLVHRIFDWLRMPDAAAYSLRSYWEAVKKEGGKKHSNSEI